MKRDTNAIIEVDDFKNTVAISRDLATQTNTVDAFEVMAQWCATLREYYISVGIELAADED